MPTFEISLPDLQATGAMIQAFVGPSRELIAAVGSESVAAPLPMSALIDTGAAITVITPEMAALLRLRSVGAIPLHTPTTIEPVICRLYHINMYLSDEYVVENIVVVEAPLTGQAFQCLVGRDVLSRGLFTYDGVHGRFSITF